MQQHCLIVLRDARVSVLTPDVGSFNAASNACEKGKHWEEVLQEIVRQLLTPDVVSFNAAISTCEKGKQWEGALQLLQEMVH